MKISKNNANFGKYFRSGKLVAARSLVKTADPGLSVAEIMPQTFGRTLAQALNPQEPDFFGRMVATAIPENA